MPCTRRLRNPDISKVYACVVLPVKIATRMLYEHISLKLMVKLFALMKENVHRSAHALISPIAASIRIFS